MSTYLFFFGKSQEFTFYAFDKSGYVQNFDAVIKDFEALESKKFKIDEIENKPILAKYIIEKGRLFSLLKLYSFAQAFDGTRVGNSIYGAAILSDKNLSLTKTNIGFLSSVKDEFAKRSLTGLKFNKSNFFKDANDIWFEVVNNKAGNLFDFIQYSQEINKPKNKGARGIFIENLKESVDSISNNKIVDVEEVYFSEDLKHLKRSNSILKEVFPIYHLKDDIYQPYKEEEIIPLPPNNGGTNNEKELNTLRYQLNNERNKNVDIEENLKKLTKSFKKKFKILSVACGVLFLTTLAFFFKSIIMDSKKSDINCGEIVKNTDTTQVRSVTTIGNPPTTDANAQSSFDIYSVLSDNTMRTTLDKLVANVNSLTKAQKQKDIDKYLQAVQRDANILNISDSFANNLVPTIQPDKAIDKANKKAEGAQVKADKKTQNDSVNAQKDVDKTTLLK